MVWVVVSRRDQEPRETVSLENGLISFCPEKPARQLCNPRGFQTKNPGSHWQWQWMDGLIVARRDQRT